MRWLVSFDPAPHLQQFDLQQPFANFVIVASHPVGEGNLAPRLDRHPFRADQYGVVDPSSQCRWPSTVALKGVVFEVLQAGDDLLEIHHRFDVEVVVVSAHRPLWWAAQRAADHVIGVVNERVSGSDRSPLPVGHPRLHRQDPAHQVLVDHRLDLPPSGHGTEVFGLGDHDVLDVVAVLRQTGLPGTRGCRPAVQFDPMSPSGSECFHCCHQSSCTSWGRNFCASRRMPARSVRTPTACLPDRVGVVGDLDLPGVDAHLRGESLQKGVLAEQLLDRSTVVDSMTARCSMDRLCTFAASIAARRPSARPMRGCMRPLHRGVESSADAARQSGSGHGRVCGPVDHATGH